MLGLSNNITPEQRLLKASVDIMAKERYVALSGVLMIGTKKVGADTPTAYTNGKDEVYGREFMGMLTDPELRFVMLHECYHKMYRHLTTWKHLWEENEQLTNMACDYVINIKIADENRDGFAAMPEMALYDERFRGMDTARVYNILKQEAEQNPQRGQGEGGEDEGGGGGFDQHDWEGAEEMTAEEKHQLEREVDAAVRQGALIAGKLGTGGERALEDLMAPQIDWREVLRDFISTTCAGNDYSTWARPNRRYVSSGVYMPSGISEQVGELVIAIDTSGSIAQPDLTLFLSEVKGICDTVHPDKVRLLYWDTEVCREEVYDMTQLDDLLNSTKPKGGGGTNVECVTRHLRDHGVTPQAAIILTDGDLYGGWGQWACPVLWTILDNKSASPDVGKYVHINSDSMQGR